MKLLVHGDLQATWGRERLYSNPDESLQHYRIKRFYSQLHDIYYSKGCEGLVDLGDTFDDRNAIPIPTLMAVVEGASEFKTGFNWKLIGNHDQYYKNTRVHSGSVLKGTFNIVESFTHKLVDGTLIIFASYPEDEDSLTADICELVHTYRQDNVEKVILFGHFQIRNLADAAKKSEGLPSSVLEGVSLTLLGHVHKPSAVAGCKDAYYLGSPFQQNFGESNESKRVAVVDTDTCEVEFIPLTGFPEYKCATLDYFLKNVSEDSEDRYRVQITSQEDAEMFYTHPLSYRAEPVYAFAQEESEDTEETNVEWGLSEAMERYVKLNPPSNFGIDEDGEVVVDYGKEILEA